MAQGGLTSVGSTRLRVGVRSGSPSSNLWAKSLLAGKQTGITLALSKVDETPATLFASTLPFGATAVELEATTGTGFVL